MLQKDFGNPQNTSLFLAIIHTIFHFAAEICKKQEKPDHPGYKNWPHALVIGKMEPCGPEVLPIPAQDYSAARTLRLRSATPMQVLAQPLCQIIAQAPLTCCSGDVALSPTPCPHTQMANSASCLSHR